MRSSVVDQVPDEIVSHILKFLPIPSIIAVAATNERCRAVVYNANFWSYMMSIYFPDVLFQSEGEIETQTSNNTNSSLSAPYRLFSILAAGHHLQNTNSYRRQPCQQGCKGTLLLPPSCTQGERRRCPCIVTRSDKCLPLGIGCLSENRSRSSCFATSHGFSTMRMTIAQHFHVTDQSRVIHPIDTITSDTLHNLDVFILCTTEGPALSQLELTSLQEWVYQHGGALITSAFSNHSTHGHYAEQTVGWLGITPTQRARFMPTTTNTVQPHQQPPLIPVAAIDDETAALVSNGPFGPVTVFRNVGDTIFRTGDSAERGAVSLVRTFGDRDLVAEGKAQLLFYPPGGRLTGRRGRVLLCSNFHWLANRDYWNGGTFLEMADGGRTQKNLFLNFVAGAVASRVIFGRDGVGEG